MRTFAYIKELYNLYELLSIRLTDPKVNPTVPSNTKVLDSKIYSAAKQAFGKTFFTLTTVFVSFVVLSIAADPKGAWLYIREILYQLKDTLKPEHSVPVLNKNTVFHKLDAFALHVFDLLTTPSNYVWLFDKVSLIVENVLNLSIVASMWGVEHWPSLFLLAITAPLAYYFNLFFIKNVKTAITAFLTNSWQNIANKIGTLSAVYHKLGNIASKSIVKAFGGFLSEHAYVSIKGHYSDSHIAYHKEESERITLYFKSSIYKSQKIQLSRPVTDKEGNFVKSKTKIVNAFVANYVHFLDATVCHYVISNLLQDDNSGIATIHDSFYIKPDCAEDLKECYKQGKKKISTR